MRTNEERIASIHKRAAELDNNKRKKQSLLIKGMSALGCLVLIVVLAFTIAQVSDYPEIETGIQGMRASIFSDNNALGFVVIGILSFLLGCSFTILCMKLKNKKDSEKKGE